MMVPLISPTTLKVSRAIHYSSMELHGVKRFLESKELEDVATI